MSGHTRHARQSGFTLIELAMVTVIMGFFMVGLIKAYELYQIDKQQREQDANMNEMRAALSRWIQDAQCVDDSGNEHGESWCAARTQYQHLGNESAGGEDAVRFPCPADPAAAPGDASYATEQRSGVTCDTSGGVIEITDSSGTTAAYRGAFPARTVGVAPSKLVDPYGNKYSYVVSADVVDEGALLGSNPAGNIKVDDGSSSTYKSRFALFSHGRNGAGAFTRGGNPTGLAADSGSTEFENVDDDATFALRQGKFMAQGDKYYDDAFAASLVDEDDDGWWHATKDSAQDITHRNPGDILIDPSNSGTNVGIGTNNPQNKLDLRGGDASFQGGNVGIGTNNPQNTLDLDGGNASFEQRVGIGTNNPLRTLEVDGWIGTFSGHGLLLGDKDWEGRVDWGGSYVQIGTAAGSNSAFRVHENNNVEVRSGNLGVGTSSPSAKLDVDGEIKIGNDGLSCDPGKEGAIRYNSSDDTTKVCKFDDKSSTWKYQSLGSVATGCTRKRSGAFDDDFVTWCPSDFPALYSCVQVDDQAPNSPMNLGGYCPNDGECPMKNGPRRRNDLGGNGIYYERVYKKAASKRVEGCVMYDKKHSHNAHKADIMCCKGG